MPINACRRERPWGHLLSASYGRHGLRSRACFFFSALSDGRVRSGACMHGSYCNCVEEVKHNSPTYLSYLPPPPSRLVNALAAEFILTWLLCENCAWRACAPGDSLGTRVIVFLCSFGPFFGLEMVVRLWCLPVLYYSTTSSTASCIDQRGVSMPQAGGVER